MTSEVKKSKIIAGIFDKSAHTAAERWVIKSSQA